jgi:nitrite reductase/ring-hydroxylating ferredoxin subunit
MAAAELAEGEPTSVDIGDTPVLLVRSAGTVRALHDRCSHRGCSLAEGMLDGDVIECGCHGSRFALADGTIERGPATVAQPAFDVREQDGQIEVRLQA